VLPFSPPIRGDSYLCDGAPGKEKFLDQWGYPQKVVILWMRVRHEVEAMA